MIGATLSLSHCPGATLCPTAAELWAKLRLAETTGTHQEYLEAYYAYWGHTCRSV